MPVLHGDAVLDTGLGCTILSGDTVVRRLCQHLQPPVVAFLVRATFWDSAREQRRGAHAGPLGLLEGVAGRLLQGRLPDSI